MAQVRRSVITLLVLVLSVALVPGAWSQTASDGATRAGVEWPTPRFADNGDGTVTDNLTGLIWLQDASCADLAGTDDDGKGGWTTALAAASALASGTCGLTDGSAAGAWGLPNHIELDSLSDAEFFPPARSNAAGTAKRTEGNVFSGVVSSYYWSLPTRTDGATGGWAVNLASGSVFNVGAKRFLFHVWPVRRRSDSSGGTQGLERASRSERAAPTARVPVGS